MRGGYYFEAWKKHLFDKVYGGDYLFGFSLKSIEFDWVVRQKHWELWGFIGRFLFDLPEMQLFQNRIDHQMSNRWRVANICKE